jgi:hypothetical protein
MNSIFIFSLLILCLATSNIYTEQSNLKHKYTIEYIQKILPNKSKFLIGQIGGIAIDKYQNLIVFHRAKRTWTPRFLYFKMLKSIIIHL